MSSIERDDMPENTDTPERGDLETDPDGRTRPTPATREFERVDQRAPHEPDRMPTAEEESLADEIGPVEPEVAEHYREMAKRGANTEGEGRI